LKRGIKLGEVNIIELKPALDSLVRMQVDSLRLGLAIVFYIANFLDYYTTKKGLEVGLKEGNPVARAIMKMGWKKYQAIKLLPTALYAYYAMTSEDPNYIWTVSLAIGAGMFIFAAVQNTMLIIGRKMATATEISYSS